MRQSRSYLMIPIYINNRDRLTTTRRMVERLIQIPEAMVVIVDNASTYPPLLEWYATECPCRVNLLGHNAGPRGAWQGMLDHSGFDHYIVTDSDLDIDSVPLDVLDVLLEGFRRYPAFNGVPTKKVGLSLRIDDIPDGYQFKQRVVSHESQFWTQKLDEQFYRADIDTTFAMYRVNPPWNGDYGPSLRTVPPYSARHCP